MQVHRVLDYDDKSNNFTAKYLHLPQMQVHRVLDYNGKSSNFTAKYLLLPQMQVQQRRARVVRHEH